MASLFGGRRSDHQHLWCTKDNPNNGTQCHSTRCTCRHSIRLREAGSMTAPGRGHTEILHCLAEPSPEFFFKITRPIALVLSLVSLLLPVSYFKKMQILVLVK